MEYSPKLKKVAAQIVALLKENDIAGVITLHTIEDPNEKKVTGYSEYVLRLTPSYSTISIEGNKLRYFGKKSHYSSSEIRDQKVASTVNMLDHLSRSTGRMAVNLIEIAEMLKSKIGDFEHTNLEEEGDKLDQDN